MITLLLVDDRPSVRAGLRLRLSLEPDIRVVGEAGNGYEALEKIQELQPMVVVMDIHMPYLDGLATTAALRAAGNPSAVILVSLYDNAAYPAQAQAAGAAAYVPKQCNPEELVAAIRAAAS
jgi:DNA-binding NarL/FixJ family response regulator